MHKRKRYYGGLFDYEEHAAMQVNLLCDKMGIKRKHPMIIVEPDALLQQVMHLLYIVYKEYGKQV